MKEVYIIKCSLPDTNNKDHNTMHYFQGCADIERPPLQAGGLSAVLTVNAWCTDINECAGFFKKSDAKKWLKAINLPGAKVVRYGYWLSPEDKHLVDAKSQVLHRRPAFILPGDTNFRIKIQPPVEDCQKN